MVLAQKPKPGANPDELEAKYGVSLSREAYDRDSQSHEFQVDESWHDAYVYVWARVDIGFQQLYSEPIELGQFKLKKSSSYWGLFG